MALNEHASKHWNKFVGLMAFNVCVAALPKHILAIPESCTYAANYRSPLTRCFMQLRYRLCSLFWAIYLTASEKRGISALRLSKHIGVSWLTEWLPLVHIMIGNMKKFINGTFHGISSVYLQEYIDEFCYRFNRRFWEPELPLNMINQTGH